MAKKKLKSLGAYLKEHRQRIGFTLREVATLTEISNAHISMIENEKRKEISVNNFMKLLDVYRLTVKDVWLNTDYFDNTKMKWIIPDFNKNYDNVGILTKNRALQFFIKQLILKNANKEMIYRKRLKIEIDQILSEMKAEMDNIKSQK